MQETPAINADVAYTLEHLRHCQSLTKLVPPRATWIGGGGFVLMLLALSHSSPYWSFRQTAQWVVFIGLFAGIYIYLRRRAISGNAFRDQVIRFSFDEEEGIGISAPSQKSQSSWSLVSSWQATKHDLVFRLGAAGGFYVVPLSTLEAPADREQLIGLFERCAGRGGHALPRLFGRGFARALALWLVILVMLLLLMTLLR